MLLTKDYSKMTLDELVSEEKKLKSSKTIVALFFGFMVGIAIWSATHNWGAFLTFGLLFFPIWVSARYSEILKKVEAEISNRNAERQLPASGGRPHGSQESD